MRAIKKYLCPVCGYFLEYPPENGAICPSCGVEFGVDTIEHSIIELQRIWLDNGAQWSSSVDLPPRNWNAFVQLQRLAPTISRDDESSETIRALDDYTVNPVRDYIVNPVPA